MAFTLRSLCALTSALILVLMIIFGIFREHVHPEAADPFLNQRRNEEAYKFVVVTRGFASHLDRTLNLIGSVHYWAPWAPVIVYWEDVPEDAFAALSCLQNVRVERSSKAGETVPSMLAHALETFDVAVYLSSDLELRASIGGIADAVYTAGYFFLGTLTSLVSTVQNIPPAHLESFATLYKQTLSQQKLCSDSIVGFARNSEAYTQVLQPLVRCSSAPTPATCAEPLTKLPLAAQLSLLAHQQGFVCQDHYHVPVERNPLFFSPDHKQTHQSHPFVLRAALPPFLFLEELKFDGQACPHVATTTNEGSASRACIAGRLADPAAAVAECLAPLVVRGGGVMRLLHTLLGAVLTLLSFLLRTFLLLAPEMLALSMLGLVLSLRPRQQLTAVVLFLLLLLGWEMLFRWRLPLMPWNRACSADSEGAWEVALANSPRAQPLALTHFRRAVDCSASTDVVSSFVADPFLVKGEGRTWDLFYEAKDVWTRSSVWNGHAVLSYSRSHDDGQTWEYGSIVLREPFHLSYPFVFQEESDMYMIPETNKASQVRLYVASRYPDRWVLARVLLAERRYVDSILIKHQGHWYLFTCVEMKMHVYHSKALTGPFLPHARNPIPVTNPRLGGRIIVDSTGRLLRFAQARTYVYGAAVHAYHVTQLTPMEYSEQPVAADDSTLLGADVCGQAWCAHRMHHIDLAVANATHNLAAVDAD